MVTEGLSFVVSHCLELFQGNSLNSLSDVARSVLGTVPRKLLLSSEVRSVPETVLRELIEPSEVRSAPGTVPRELIKPSLRRFSFSAWHCSKDTRLALSPMALAHFLDYTSSLLSSSPSLLYPLSHGFSLTPYLSLFLFSTLLTSLPLASPLPPVLSLFSFLIVTLKLCRHF